MLRGARVLSFEIDLNIENTVKNIMKTRRGERSSPLREWNVLFAYAET